MSSNVGEIIALRQGLDTQSELIGLARRAEADVGALKSFLESWGADGDTPEPARLSQEARLSDDAPVRDESGKYMRQIAALRRGARDSLEIDVADMQEAFSNEIGKKGPLSLMDSLVMNTDMYLANLYRVALELYEDGAVLETRWARHRRAKMAESGVSARLAAPFAVRLAASPSAAVPLRNVDASAVGSLVTVIADVVSVGQATPRLQVRAYECEACHETAFQPISFDVYLPLEQCEACLKKHGKRSRLTHQARLSKFALTHTIRFEELPDEVPKGGLPTTLEGVVTVGTGFRAAPGQRVLVTGILGTEGRGNMLEPKLTVLSLRDAATRVTKPVPEGALATLKAQPGLADLLARSFAPDVQGMLEIKLAILLQLVGGVPAIKGDGGLVRGDIHVLLMGDPGVAKSQLLRAAAEASPVGVLANGRGSSSCGLTASLTRDKDGQFVLEGGALVLADGGLCCIDEFDKMDERDRAAIYEAMEQQTVSVAKAAQLAQLPCRCALLAAANPRRGFYDGKLTPAENINLPPALLTRFDLLFLLLDTPERATDRALADGVAALFTGDAAPKVPDVPPELLRRLIADARLVNPRINDLKVQKLVTTWYQHVRAAPKSLAHVPASPRLLLALLRLAQALARLRFDSQVRAADVRAAKGLLHAAQASLARAGPAVRGVPVAAAVLRALQQLAAGLRLRDADWNGLVPLALLDQTLSAQNVTTAASRAVLREYQRNQMVAFNHQGTHVRFIS